MPKGNTKRSFGQLSPSELGHNAKFPHTAGEPDLSDSELDDDSEYMQQDVPIASPVVSKVSDPVATAVITGLGSIAQSAQQQPQQPAKTALTTRVYLNSAGWKHFGNDPAKVSSEIVALVERSGRQWEGQVWRPKGTQANSGLVFATKDKELHKFLTSSEALASAFMLDGASTVVPEEALPQRERKPRFCLVFKGIPLSIDVSSQHVQAEFQKRGLSAPKRHEGKDKQSKQLVKVEALTKAAFYKAILEGVWLHLANYKAEEDWKVPQCFKCQQIDVDGRHIAKKCSNAQVCVRCAEPHCYKQCQSSSLKCANCKKEHSACSRACEQVRAAENSHRKVVKAAAIKYLDECQRRQLQAEFEASQPRSSQQQQPSSRPPHGFPRLLSQVIVPAQLQPTEPFTVAAANSQQHLEQLIEQRIEQRLSDFTKQLAATTQRAEAAEKQVADLQRRAEAADQRAAAAEQRATDLQKALEASKAIQEKVGIQTVRIDESQILLGALFNLCGANLSEAFADPVRAAQGFTKFRTLAKKARATAEKKAAADKAAANGDKRLSVSGKPLTSSSDANKSQS